MGKSEKFNKKNKLSRKFYEKELDLLETELIKLEEWIKVKGLKVVIIFEGRDAAGKGGVIGTITKPLNPRFCKVHALGTPTEREKTQWYFQRYVNNLPAAGEMILFDRSWYNRAGVEKVMNFCANEEYLEFLKSCPEFENMLIRSGVIIIKYWFSVTEQEQEKRFNARIADPRKSWKFSPIDLESRTKWLEYSAARDEMFKSTDTEICPWNIVPADDKRKARLNTIKDLLSKINYQEIPSTPVVLTPRKYTESNIDKLSKDVNYIHDYYKDK